MSGWPANASFVDRHMATMDLMKALKTSYDLPQSALASTASELQDQLLKQSSSKDDFLRLVADRVSSLKEQSNTARPKALPTTTGISEEPDAEAQSIGRFRGIYHAESLTATIYRQTEPGNGPPAVLKVVRLEAQVAPHNIQHERDFLLRLAGTEHIIKLLGHEQIAGGLLALRLPYMRYDVGSLAALNAVSAAQKRRLLRDVFEALGAVHGLGIVHRDVKPANILLDSVEGPAYLADFGISWHAAVNADEPADGKITDVGTGCYRAPELLFGCRDYGAKMDMWAAGCTMAEVLVGGGRTLFDAGPVSREDFLGSDLRLINSLFQTRGTPTDETWPEARSFRDWGKIGFKEFAARPWAELLPGVEERARDVVAGLVVFESGQRLSAEQVLEHPYFADSPPADDAD